MMLPSRLNMTPTGPKAAEDWKPTDLYQLGSVTLFWWLWVMLSSMLQVALTASPARRKRKSPDLCPAQSSLPGKPLMAECSNLQGALNATAA